MKHLFLPAMLALAMTLSACNKGDGKDEPTPDPVVTEAANTMVMYECNERLFAESEAFKAIDAYLPTLQEMGVNVLWLMPVQPRGEKNSVGSPYCVKDYKGIDSKFGTLADLKTLVNDCHSRGMIVILDWIANHSAWDNAWVTEHPDWYTSAQTSDERNWSDVTFLDYTNSDVRAAMKDAMLYWINNADIDGFRCDYAHGVPTDFWSDVNAAIKALKPNGLLLAETSKTEYYDAGFDMLYSWNYLYAVEGLYQGTKTFSSLISTSESEFATTPAGKTRMRYVTTHDESSEKSPYSVFHSAQGELSAFALTCFLGGVPMIYSSQEIGNMNTVNFFNYNIMDFSSQPAVTNAYKALMKAYLSTATLRSGTQTTGSISDAVPYVQYTQGDSTLLFVCNITNAAVSVKYPMAHIGATETNMLTGEQETFGSMLNLDAYEYRVYVK